MEYVSQSANWAGERKEISVLFSDIYRYSALTENLEANEVACLINDYFEAVGEAVLKYKHALDRQVESACVGTAAIAVFGSPLPLENHAWCALETAMEMCQKVAEFNARRVSASHPEIKIGIGINSDKVTSSYVGRTNMMEFTAIGESVNLGQLLERLSQQYGCQIVIGENTYRSCKDQIWVRQLDSLRLQGKSTPVAIYEVLALRSDSISEHKLQAVEYYDKGRERYLKRQFAIAMGEFATVMEIDSSDKAAAIQLERCQHFLQSPPPDDWDGAWTVADMEWKV
ncbi:adenylate/guanylate cyclase domain-containing protein [Kamptonema formosum]|uniref:adenylate/guanylate cyclase domain-containing protein n=1 Tax=Kamptonema formosum TaxID=331992 RepID=UPI00037479B5|nr:adenylate/guanylate cyclase domain-containing protein [Oscillatoria sp. PCC 10802]